MKQIVEYEGKRYVWTGTTWYGERDFMHPPSGIIHILNSLIADSVNEADDAITCPRELCRLASALRDSKGQLKRALRLAYRANQLAPDDAGIASVLSSILRLSNRSEEAIAITDKLEHVNYVPLLTSRPAAFCDLEQWPAALKCVRRALAISKGKDSGEALSVWQRIRANAPELIADNKTKLGG